MVGQFKYRREIWGWVKHQDDIVKTAKIAMVTIRRALYRVKEFRVDWVFKIFDEVIKAIIGYGVKIWEAYMERKQLN